MNLFLVIIKSIFDKIIKILIFYEAKLNLFDIVLLHKRQVFKII